MSFLSVFLIPQVNSFLESDSKTELISTLCRFRHNCEKVPIETDFLKLILGDLFVKFSSVGHIGRLFLQVRAETSHLKPNILMHGTETQRKQKWNGILVVMHFILRKYFSLICLLFSANLC